MRWRETLPAQIGCASWSPPHYTPHRGNPRGSTHLSQRAREFSIVLLPEARVASRMLSTALRTEGLAPFGGLPFSKFV